MNLRRVQAWLAAQPEPVAVELVCTEHPAAAPGPADSVVVRAPGCLAEAPVHEVVELLGLGAATVCLRLDGCDRPAAAAERFAALLAVLRAGGVDRMTLCDRPPVGRLRRRPVLDGGHMPLPRRQVLGLGRLGRDVARELPAEYADPHERLVAALRALVPATAVTALDSPAVRLRAGGCTACGVCVQGCPGGALTLDHVDAGDGMAVSTLRQDAACCDGCRRCVELCPVSVLVAVGHRSWSETLRGTSTAVATLTTATCCRCRARFPTASGDELCPVCTYRRANPFGSRIPAVTAGSRA